MRESKNRRRTRWESGRVKGGGAPMPYPSARRSIRLLAGLFAIGVAVTASAPNLGAAPNPPPPMLKAGMRTNAAPLASRPFIRTNQPPAAPRSSLGTNAATAARATSKTNAAPATSKYVATFRRFQAGRAFYPTLAGICVLVGAAAWFLYSRSKARKPALPPAAELASKPALKPLKAGASKARLHSCNVLNVGPDARRLWNFDAGGGRFSLNRQQTSLAGESLPLNLVGKSWASLFQPKLNIAWLPPEQVFLRVAQFPLSDFNETLAMVEIQLEKLSPMPVAQVVWTIQILPHAKGNMQTVIVMIAARDAVEEFLGQLEGQGYLADNLNLPLLDQLLATPVTEDGAWIYPETGGGKNSALVAWWYDGVLQNLALLSLPPANRPESLKEQLMQMAWAGELEGWLKGAPRWHMVAEAAVAAEWEPVLRAGLDQPVEIRAPLSAPELAALTARRAALAGPTANLLPAEFSTRYQQQFVDRLWMRGLLAVGGLYLIGVAIYAVALGVLTVRTNGVEAQITQKSLDYTNAVQLKARYGVLKDRQELKFAALDCWDLVAKLMPTDLTLESLNFTDGKKLSLNGTAPAGQASQINDFETAMRKSVVKGQPFFDPLAGDHFTYHNIPGGGLGWNFGLELKRSEALQ